MRYKEIVMTERQRNWAYVFAWTGLIYATLYIARPICTFLKETTPFELLVNGLCITAFVVIIILFFKQPRSFSLFSYFLLGAVLIAYFYGISVLEYPEEKIHFAEYGILAFLIFRALRLDISAPFVYPVAFVLVTGLGWIDEGIQNMLPNRYYQNQDVLLNSASGFLGLILTYLFQGGNK